MKSEIDRLHCRIDELEAKVASLQGQLTVAVQLLQLSPESALAKSRVILERTVKDLYDHLEIPLPSRGHDLGGLLNNNQLTRQLPSRIVLRMNTVREYGNLGVHDKGEVAIADGVSCLTSLVEILDWYSDDVIGVPVRPNPRTNGDHGDASLSVPADGVIEVEIDAGNCQQVVTLTASVAGVLENQGAGRATIDKCGIALQELLSNVVKHAGDPENLAKVWLGIDSPPALVVSTWPPVPRRSEGKTVQLKVSDRGKGFSLEQALSQGLLELKEKQREHGLLRMVRYGCGLWQTVVGLHTIHWSSGGATALDPDRPPWDDEAISGLLLRTNPRVFPLVLEIDHYVVLGTEVYRPPEELIHVVTAAGAVDHTRPYEGILSASEGLLNILLDPLRRANPDVVCIAVFGRHPTIDFGNPTGLFHVVTQHALKMLAEHLPRTRVLILVDSEYETNHEWVQFARERELESSSMKTLPTASNC